MANIEALQEVLRRTLDFSPVNNMGVTDILFDPATDTVALTGKALILELRALKHNVRGTIEANNFGWARLFNIPIERHGYGTRPQWFHDNDTHLSQFIPELSGAIKDAYAALAGESWGETVIETTIIPQPGYPWRKGKTKEIYSAKKNKWFTVETPPYLTYVKDRDGETRPAVDFCVLAPRVDKPLFQGEIARLDDVGYICTHATSLARESHKVDEEMLKQVAKCGGLLYPSLATGVLPATNFGETVLVVNASVPAMGMAPYKGKGAWPVITYPSDVWTTSLGEVLNSIGIAAFEQLHGSMDLDYQDHFFILGPEVKEEGYMDVPVKPINSTDKLASALRRKFKMWTRDMDFERFTELSNAGNPNRYGYLETKVNGIVDWDLIPYAVCPTAMAGQVRDTLVKMGFIGEIITIDVEPQALDALLDRGNMKMEERDWVKYQYAWDVADAIGRVCKVVEVSA
jgi:hypothetical protein